MSPFIQHAIEKLNRLYKETTGYKQEKLLTLKRLLLELQSSHDINENKIAEILRFSRSCLNDPLFTHKQVNLFGILTSHSERFVEDLIKLIKNHKTLLFLDKLAAYHPHETLDDIKILFQHRDYKTAREKLHLIKEYYTHHQAPQEAYLYLDNYLTHLINNQIRIGTKTYNARMTPILEINSTQKVYDIDALKNYMHNQPENQSVSFTMAIDLYHNVLFSVGANNSYHVNICSGNPVHGAGEVYLTRHNSQIILQIISNKSGLYLPDTEFFNALKPWFNTQGFNVDNAQLHDERLNITHDLIYAKHILR